MSNLKMVHPDIEAVAEVVDEVVYGAVWAPKGWVLLGEAEGWASDQLGRKVTDLQKDLKLDELKALVSLRGAEWPAAARAKADVADLYRDSFVEAPPQPPADTEAFAPPPEDPEAPRFADDGSGLGVTAKVLDPTDLTGDPAGEGPSAGNDSTDQS